MKKDWLCRGSYDEKNQEIAPMMMPSDDPDPVMMFSDDPDPMMKMTLRWIWLEDEEELNMKTTWRWIWQDDPVDTEKKTSAENFVERIPS